MIEIPTKPFIDISSKDGILTLVASQKKSVSISWCVNMMIEAEYMHVIIENGYEISGNLY